MVLERKRPRHSQAGKKVVAILDLKAELAALTT
jgi:hypothetical protein